MIEQWSENALQTPVPLPRPANIPLFCIVHTFPTSDAATNESPVLDHPLQFPAAIVKPPAPHMPLAPTSKFVATLDAQSAAQPGVAPKLIPIT